MINGRLEEARLGLEGASDIAIADPQPLRSSTMVAACASGSVVQLLAEELEDRDRNEPGGALIRDPPALVSRPLLRDRARDQRAPRFVINGRLEQAQPQQAPVPELRRAPSSASADQPPFSKPDVADGASSGALDLHRLFPTRHLWSERWHAAGTTAVRRPKGACGDSNTSTNNYNDVSAVVQLFMMLMLVIVLMLILQFV